MALSRISRKSVSWWEVDGSGLMVWKSQWKGGWEIAETGHQTSASASEYLLRHALLNQRFPTRARAVDALRLALSEEPFQRQVQTRWTRVYQGVYNSQDGNWRLEKGPKGRRGSTCSRAAIRPSPVWSVTRRPAPAAIGWAITTYVSAPVKRTWSAS